MDPVLIDTRSWLKFGFIAVFFAAVIFAAGFIFGYKNATTYFQTVSGTESSILAEGSAAASDQIESETPKSEISKLETSEPITEAENRDVVQYSDDMTQTNHVESIVIESYEVTSNEVTTELAAESTIESREIPVATTTVIDIPQTSRNGIRFKSENIDKIKFSIQTGFYGSLSNAEKAVMKLKADNYDAYASEYLNKKNEIRYNVRLGYFVDKQSALPTLYTFRREKKSDAYLVKFSADSMIVFVDDDPIMDVADQ